MPLLDLPNELLLQVAHDVDTPTLSALTRTNRRLAHLLSADLLNTALKNRRYSVTAIFLAISYKQAARIKLLLERSTQITITSKYGTVIYDSGVCKIWHKDMNRLVDRLVEEGNTDLVIFDKPSGRTALHWAAAYGDAAMVRKLLCLGAGKSYVHDRAGKTPLHCAAASANVTVVRALLEHKAWKAGEIDAADKGIYELCALHYAVQAGDRTTTELLLKGGARADIVNVFGETALHIAAQERDLGMVRLLLGAGADVDAQDFDGVTPLHCVVENNDVEVARVLVDAGADIHKPSSFFGTPFVQAVVRWGEDMARVLSESEWEKVKGKSRASMIVEQLQANRARRRTGELF
ncbi:uncharacterized protein LAJ45_03864 [Morchella importuna]|nr:uncharacterized protein LAJ45_03864 [Morchella importuna]KAH8151871.1 hypothetical protein LAJ45_03864 [Morchella importuna]